MIWVEITLADVISHLPTDIKSLHDEWVANYPAKSGRLAEITANTIREFRDAIKSNPANIVDPRETWLPQSAVRHAESLIIFNLAMEMGVTIDSSGNSARTSADVFLRQIPYGRWNTTLEGDDTMPSPRFVVPERTETTGRALPLVVALILLAASSWAGWIRPGSTVYDTGILTTFSPSAYSNTSHTVFGHFQGINQAFSLQQGLVGGLLTNSVKKSGDVVHGPLIVSNTLTAAALAGTGTETLAIRNNPPSDGATRARDIDLWQPIASQGEHGRVRILNRQGQVTFQVKSNSLAEATFEGISFTTNLSYPPAVSLTATGGLRLGLSPGAEPRVWLTTNSYLSPLDSLTSLFFVVLQPPSTNRMGL